MLPSPSRKPRSWSLRSHWACPPNGGRALRSSPRASPCGDSLAIPHAPPRKALRAARLAPRRKRLLRDPPSFPPRRTAPLHGSASSVRPPPSRPGSPLPGKRRRRAPPHLWMVRLLTPPASQASSLRAPGWAPCLRKSFGPPFCGEGLERRGEPSRQTPAGSACGRAWTARHPPEPRSARKAGTKDLSPERSRES